MFSFFFLVLHLLLEVMSFVVRVYFLLVGFIINIEIRDVENLVDFKDLALRILTIMVRQVDTFLVKEVYFIKTKGG